MNNLGFRYTPEGIRQNYGITVRPGSDHKLVSRLASSLDKLPAQLIKDCGISDLGFEDLGESKEYFPNHGYYTGETLVLNSRLVDDPIIFAEKEGDEGLDRFDHTLFHELGHGWDVVKGSGGDQGALSYKPEWLDLSGWKEKPEDGLVRIVINDKGSEERIGEWCYDPESKFVRFYARTNPWDDFADTFAFYVADQEGFIPDSKFKYFKDRLDRYYE